MMLCNPGHLLAGSAGIEPYDTGHSFRGGPFSLFRAFLTWPGTRQVHVGRPARKKIGTNFWRAGEKRPQKPDLCRWRDAARASRAVIGAGLYLTVLGLLALAIGTTIRHTAGAISTIIGIVFVLPILTGLLPSSWGAHINAYLPEQAGTLITHTHEQSGDLLSPWQGFGVLCIWTVLALAAAAYLLQRRDA